jgi:hypothetical protein
MADDGAGKEVLIPELELRGPPLEMSWGAVLAGAVAALSLWLMLYTLGLALGLSAVGEGDASDLRASGLFTGVWSLLAPLLALFIGGLVAGRVSGALSRGAGALHGLVVWGLTALAGAWALAWLLTSLAGGVAALGTSAVQAGAGAVSSVEPRQLGALARSFGIDAEQALAPVNARLRAAGKPEVGAEQLQAAARESVQQALQQGRLDRAMLARSVAAHTALSAADSDEIAGRIEAQFDAALARTRESLQTGALQAAQTTGRALWGVFAALFLGLLAALTGAALGSSRH